MSIDKPKVEKSKRLPNSLNRLLVGLATLLVLQPTSALAKDNFFNRITSEIGRNLEHRAVETGRKALDAKLKTIFNRTGQHQIDKQIEREILNAINTRARLEFEIAGIKPESLVRMQQDLGNLLEWAQANDLELFREMVGDDIPKNRTSLDPRGSQHAKMLLDNFVAGRLADMAEHEANYTNIMQIPARQNGVPTQEYLSTMLGDKPQRLSDAISTLDRLAREHNLNQEELARTNARIIWREGDVPRY